MSRHLAAFQVLKDGPFTMKKGDPPRKLKTHTTLTTDSYALLAYKVWTNGKPMKYQVKVVDYNAAPDKYTYVGPFSYEGPISYKTPVGVWEAFPASAAATGDEVIFEVTSGEGGTVTFSDVVLWTMRN